MLVYGDAVRRERAREKLGRVGETLARVAASAPGLARHALAVEALIEAGELTQGLADRAAGGDASASTSADAAMALTMAVASRCATSWASGFSDAGETLADDVERCSALVADIAIEAKQPEGYAFYLVYPESYFVAARSLASRRWQVIGIRSIGTSLACMVAVGLGAPPPITVRPGGAPFARSLAADAALIDRDVDAYAIVDEGPGLSGSSFAAVSRWLRDSGVAEERIHFFAAHRRGPGPEASAEIRASWARAARDGRVHATTFDDLVLRATASAHRLETWVESLVGPLEAPLREIGGGVWRDLQPRAALVPPAHPWQERRKFLAIAGGTWLVKFNGLGTASARKLARARALAASGFTPQPLGCCHGFIVERWRDDAMPLPDPLPRRQRAALIETIGAYLAFRARRFSAPAQSGASIDALAAMARQNTLEALGPSASDAWQRWRSEIPALPVLASAVRRIETDNRMQRWEWLASSAGILKTDAIDHHAGHDLVGCQDVAWDIAGAACEFELSRDEEQRLAADVVARAAITVSGPLTRFYAVCYAAFQLGYYDDAGRAAEKPAEAERLLATRGRYAARLRAMLGASMLTPTR